MRFTIAMAAVCLVAACLICPAWAAPVTLTDINSTFVVDPTSNTGATVWNVDGVDQLFLQQWYYRLGPTGSIYSINNLGTPVVATYHGTQGVEMTYTAVGFEVYLNYLLYGGYVGSGSSAVSKVFRIRNTGPTPLSFSLFEYSDFDLQGHGSDDSAVHPNANVMQQWDNKYRMAESVVRTPDRWQLSNPFSLTGDLTNTSGSIGPTDCAWAYQWNLVIPVNGSVVFSQDQEFTLVPEPSSLLALGGCLGWICAFRRRQR